MKQQITPGCWVTPMPSCVVYMWDVPRELAGGFKSGTRILSPTIVLVIAVRRVDDPYQEAFVTANGKFGWIDYSCFKHLTVVD
jgi:hypothetical protein